MAWVRQDFARRSLLDNFTVGEDDDAIGEGAREVVVVRRNDQCSSAARKTGQRLAEIDAAGRVQ